MKKIYCENNHINKVGVSILISDKPDFRMRNIIGNKERQFIMKGSICEEDIIIPTVYAPNNTFQNTLSKN